MPEVINPGNELASVESFAALVKQMRDAQNSFFQDRTKTSLRLAKVLESRVDSLIKQLTGPKEKPPTQTNIFE